MQLYLMMPMTSCEDQRACEALALRLLTQRDHSRQELARKLRQRSQWDEQTLAVVLDDLEKRQYLDDVRFAEVFIRSSVARGQGPIRIGYELRERGVADSVINPALSQADVDWDRLAARQRTKKFGADMPGNQQESARQYRFLAGRGFYRDSIKAALQTCPDEWPE